MNFFRLYVCVAYASWASAGRSPADSRGAGWRLGPGAPLRQGVGDPGPGDAFPRGPASRFASLPGVFVTCSSMEVTVRVSKHLYADAERLSLGRTCVSNGADRRTGDPLFRYPLTACDAVRELQPGHILYWFLLSYSSRRDGVLRHRLECRLSRYHHVHRLAVSPTWHTPTSKVLRNQLADYQIQQMNADWSARHASKTYFLGQKINLQVSAHFLPAGGKLYVDSCYATASEVPGSTPRHMVLGNYGCMVEPTGFFVTRSSGRIAFSFRAFQLTHGPSAQMFLHCRLFVMAGGPSATAKSCSYSEEGRWKALTGPDSVCDCCDSSCTPFPGKQPVFKGFPSSGLFVFNKKSRSPGTIPVSNTPTKASSHLTTLDVPDNSNTPGDEDLVWYNGYEDKGKEKAEVLLLNMEPDPAEVCREREELSFLKGLPSTSEKEEGCVDVSHDPGLRMGKPTFPKPSSELSDKLAPSAVRDAVEDDYTNYGLVSGVGEVMVLVDY